VESACFGATSVSDMSSGDDIWRDLDKYQKSKLAYQGEYNSEVGAETRPPAQGVGKGDKATDTLGEPCSYVRNRDSESFRSKIYHSAQAIVNYEK
jgi:hypothetical protein